jgi:hypothetical protein
MVPRFVAPAQWRAMVGRSASACGRPGSGSRAPGDWLNYGAETGGARSRATTIRMEAWGRPQNPS